jgi:DNA (cytosine-5)-methyltransferase 1
MSDKANVIDLFAGPGGLGEGFSCLGKRKKRFKIRMSVEMEVSAHKTLELRAFVRQFPEPPWDYYDYLRGTISREELFGRYSAEAAIAVEETLNAPRELGGRQDDELIYSRLRSLKRKHDGPWVVIGGPPCQAYSLVGRARNRGVKGYRPEEDKRHFLYTEYLRVLQIIRPEVFVMENVKGILSSKVQDQRIFPRLLEDLRCPNRALGKRATRQGRYRIYSLVTGEEIGDGDTAGSDCIIRSENYGVPQTRHRVILLGVREDSKSGGNAGRPARHSKRIVEAERLKRGVGCGGCQAGEDCGQGAQEPRLGLGGCCPSSEESQSAEESRWTICTWQEEVQGPRQPQSVARGSRDRWLREP